MIRVRLPDAGTSRCLVTPPAHGLDLKDPQSKTDRTSSRLNQRLQASLPQFLIQGQVQWSVDSSKAMAQSAAGPNNTV